MNPRFVPSASSRFNALARINTAKPVDSSPNSAEIPMDLEICLARLIEDVLDVVPPLHCKNPKKRWSLGQYGLIAKPPAAFKEICSGLTKAHIDRLESNFLMLPDETPLWNGQIIRSQAAFGMYLLMLFAGIARDHASDGSLWPNVYKNLKILRPEVRSRLFDNEQPNKLAKDSIEKAVVFFQLRNALHGIGMQKWYSTLMLQYGFSLTDWRESPQGWMSGAGRPQSVCILLGQTNLTNEQLQDAPESASFIELWKTLQAYHRGRITREAGVRSLEGTMWISAAQAQQMLLCLDDSRTLVPELADEDGSRYGLGTPHLVWQSGRPPICVVELKLPTQVKFCDDSYSIALHGKPIGQIHHDPDQGTWSNSFPVAMNTPDVLGAWISRPLSENPWSEPTLCRLNGEVIDVFCLSDSQLPQEDEPLVLYPWDAIENGQGWSPIEQTRNTQNFVLLLPPRMKTAVIHGAEIIDNHQCQSSVGWRAVKIFCREQSQLRLTDGKDELWVFKTEQHTQATTRVALHLKESFKSNFTMNVDFVPPAKLISVEIEGNSCDIRVGAFTAPLRFFGGTKRTVQVRITARDSATGRLIVVRREVSYPQPCLLTLQGAEFLRHPSHKPLQLNCSTEIRLHVPIKAGTLNHTPFLTEAMIPIMSARKLVRTQTGLRLGKFMRTNGSPLFYQPDLLNSDDRERTQLASSVFWGGIVANQSPEIEEQCGIDIIYINTTEPQDPRPNWKLQVLNSDGHSSLHNISEFSAAQVKTSRIGFVLDSDTTIGLKHIVAVRILGTIDVCGSWSCKAPLDKLAKTDAAQLWNIIQEWDLPIDVADLYNDPRIVALRADPKSLLTQVELTWGGVDHQQLVTSRHEMLVSALLWDYVPPTANSAAELCDAVAILPASDSSPIERQFLALSLISPWLARNTLKALESDKSDGLSNPMRRERRSRIESFLRQRMSPLKQQKLEEAAFVFVFDKNPLDYDRPRSPVASFTPGLDSQFLLQMIADASRSGPKAEFARLNIRLLHNATRNFGRSHETRHYCFGPLAASQLINLL